ncbi:unnamed protein product [Heterobilharzia americana]|nr:unnamed protein product [Heterobilharzia americana]
MQYNFIGNNHFIVNGLCSKLSGSIIASYQIIEESNVPMTVSNLKKDLCIDQYAIEQYIHFDQYSYMYEFVLFPTSQPFYNYFEIKNESINHSLVSISNTFKTNQYLILRKSIDREIICNWPDINVQSNSRLIHSKINHNFYSNSYIQQNYNEDTKMLCNCQELLGWCSIYLHLALIPLNKTQSDNNNNNNNNTVTYTISDIDEIITTQSNDHWLNYINIMQFFNIELRIIDINDNSPVFSPSNYKIIMSESDKPGTIYRLPSAIDQDLGINSMLTYDIALVNASNSQEINKLYLKLLKPLDREVYTSYNLKIIAIDKGLSHQNTGTLNLYIHVADINDETPVFLQKQYVFHVSENTSPGTIIGQVKAIDMDIGQNSIINYSIKEIEPYLIDNQYNIDLFHIDQMNGEIKLNKLLDREKISQIILRIEAKDSGQPSKSTLTSVTILIDDINDNNPNIDLLGYKEILNSTGLFINNIHYNDLLSYQLISLKKNSLIPIHIWVSEYLNIKSIVGIVKVNDPDHGINGSVQCKLNTSHFILQPKNLYEFNNNNNNNNKHYNQFNIYYIISSELLDYELQTIHHLPIICSDIGEPIAKTSILLLNIHVKDENDNFPKFLLPEIFSPAQWLNKNQFIINSIESNHINSLFDFHKKLLLYKTIPIEIIIPETCLINTSIIKFSVLDIDSGLNSLLTYKLTLINQYFINEYNLNKSTTIINKIDFIQINNITGIITICKSLKLISENIKYLYEIIVSDHGLPKKSSQLYLSLQIIIVNSFPPEIELFQSNNINGTMLKVYKNNFDKKYELEIYENQPPGTLIGQIIGYDSDRGEAGRVTFNIIQSLVRTCNGSLKKTEDTILIDSNSGIITTLRSIDREFDGDLFLISLQFQDHGTPIYTESIHIDIKVLDMNDNPPVFILPLNSCDILHPFIQFKAEDIDLGINSLITYHLKENCTKSLITNTRPINHLFVIDELSGCLSLIRRINDEHLSTNYTFCIIAQDHGKVIQYKSIIIVNIEIKLQDNESLIFMNYSVNSIGQSIDSKLSMINTYVESEDFKQQQQQQTLTPVIRTLLCITTIIGGLMIIVVGILSIKQPTWLICNLCKINSKEAAKAELLQFHEVHNQIEVQQSRKQYLDIKKSGDLEMERCQNHPLLCASVNTSTNDISITQTQPVQIHLPHEYNIEQGTHPNITDPLLAYFPYSSQFHHSNPPDPPVFLHIVRTCDILDDPELMKPVVKTTTTGHIVENEDTKCIYCSEKHVENWNQNIV